MTVALNALPAIAERDIVPGRHGVIRVQVRLIQPPAVRPVLEDIDVAAQRAGGQAERGVERRGVGTGLQVGVVEYEAPDAGSVVLVVEAVLGPQIEGPCRTCRQLDVQRGADDQRIGRGGRQAERQRRIAEEGFILRAASIGTRDGEARAGREAVSAGDVELMELVAGRARHAGRLRRVGRVVPGDRLDVVVEDRPVVTDVEGRTAAGVAETRVVLLGHRVDRLRQDHRVLLDAG